MNNTQRIRYFLLASLILIAAGALSAAGVASIERVRGSGDQETRQYDIEGFTEVEVGHAFAVSVREGADFRVSITADDNLFDYLRVEVVRDALEIGLRPRVNLNSVRVEIEIVMPRLEAISLSGAARGEIAVDRGSSEFRADVSGASALTGRLRAGTVEIDLSGASRLDLVGSAELLRADVSGASRVLLFEFPLDQVEATVSGASRLEVTVATQLEVDASGASTVRYQGEPGQLLVDTSGSSTVSRR